MLVGNAQRDQLVAVLAREHAGALLANNFPTRRLQAAGRCPLMYAALVLLAITLRGQHDRRAHPAARRRPVMKGVRE